MKFEQHVEVRIVDTVSEFDDIYDDDSLSDYIDSDGISSAEEGFLRGYLGAV